MVLLLLRLASPSQEGWQAAPSLPSPYNPATPEEIYHLHKAVCLELVKRLTGTSAAGSDFSLRLFVRWET